MWRVFTVVLPNPVPRHDHPHCHDREATARQAKQAKQARNPPFVASTAMSALPTLRMLVRPEPGFGLDARIPMGKQVRCYLAAEAYIHGGSSINFGLEPARLPFLRLQVAPSTKLVLRLPVVGVSEFKYVVGGGAVTIYREGVRIRPRLGGGIGDFWKSVRRFVGGVVEVEHRNTLLGTLLDAGQRKALRETVMEIQARRDERMARRVQEREDILRSGDGVSLAPLDPRKRFDAATRLRDMMQKKYGGKGVVRGKAREDLEKMMMERGIVVPRESYGNGKLVDDEE